MTPIEDRDEDATKVLDDTVPLDVSKITQTVDVNMPG